MKKFPLFFLALIAPHLVMGQSVVSFVPPNPILTDCNSQELLTIQGGFKANAPQTGYVFIDPTKTVDCPSVPPTGQVPKYMLVSVNGADANGKATLRTSELLNAVGACANPAPVPGSGTLCLYFNNAFSARGLFSYDTTPNTITLNGVSAGNKRIVVNIRDPKSSNSNYSPTYQVCFNQDASAIDALVGKTSDCPQDHLKESSSRDITIENSENYKPYSVTARVKGSSNEWTGAQQATPFETYGFGKVYDGAPNRLSWSCTQTSATPGTWMLFLILGIFLRRPSRRFLNCFAMLAMTLSIPALADLGQVNLSITGAPYRPNLDASTKTDGNIARQFYGTMFYDNLLPLMGLEVDVHLIDDFGSLQLGLGTSYAYAGGNALVVSQDGTLSNNRSSDSAGLHMLHLKPQLTYALDTWVDTVPLAPYVRGGIVAMSYLFTYQGGIDREPGGINPMGFVFGWEAAAGLMLAMDWMEPRVSSAARANGAYDHIYLKAEAAYMPINNFGQNGLNFSNRWPTPDLPLMLTFGLVFEFK